MLKSLLLSALLAVGAVAPGDPAEPEYRLVVVSESGDIITWIRVKDGKLESERVVPIGIMPADIDGPHNVTIAPDNKSYYVSVAHGTPYGSLWRLDAFNDTLIGRAPVELFPTTISVTPDGELAFVANSDFYGDRPRVNPLSIVHTPKHDYDHQPPGVRHAARGEGESCRRHGVRLVHAFRRAAGTRHLHPERGPAGEDRFGARDDGWWPRPRCAQGDGGRADSAATATAASAPSPAAAPDHAGHDMGSMSMTGPNGRSRPVEGVRADVRVGVARRPVPLRRLQRGLHHAGVGCRLDDVHQGAPDGEGRLQR